MEWKLLRNHKYDISTSENYICFGICQRNTSGFDKATQSNRGFAPKTLWERWMIISNGVLRLDLIYFTI